MQVVDFDEFIDKLKDEKKMVEIRIPQSPATTKNKVSAASLGDS